MPVTYDNGIYIGQMSPDDAWRDAIAKYEARAAAPRNDVFGETLQADTPEALKEELFAPLQAYQEQLINRRAPMARALAARPYQFHSGTTGEQTLFNPNTGAVRTLREGRQPEMGQREKIDYQDLLRQRAALLGNQMIMFTAEGRKRLADIDEQLKAFQQQSTPTPTPQPFTPAPNLGPTVPEKPSFAFAGESLDLGGGQPAVPFGRNLFEPPTSPAPSGASEVTRKTKDGRTAVFDARTKQFLRYAD